MYVSGIVLHTIIGGVFIFLFPPTIRDGGFVQVNCFINSPQATGGVVQLELNGMRVPANYSRVRTTQNATITTFSIIPVNFMDDGTSAKCVLVQSTGVEISSEPATIYVAASPQPTGMRVILLCAC